MLNPILNTKNELWNMHKIICLLFCCYRNSLPVCFV